jgi:murein DD-endopeptidase MepM/ murein hydrolase activator NlpD
MSRQTIQNAVTFSFPLDERDAAAGNRIAQEIPRDNVYYVGPFYCDASPRSHTGRFENAIDFIVPDGTPVYAAAAGIIVDIVEDNEKYGVDETYAHYANYVTIQHTESMYTQYAHLEQFSSRVCGLYRSKYIAHGQMIGFVGKTGWIEYGEHGDHLHFMAFCDTDDSFESIPVNFGLSSV